MANKARNYGKLYNEKIIKEKAILLSKEYDISRFSASNGWLQSFKSLYEINQKILSGEASCRSKEDYAEFYVTFQGKLLEYQTENIFNCMKQLFSSNKHHQKV